MRNFNCVQRLCVQLKQKSAVVRTAVPRPHLLFTFTDTPFYIPCVKLPQTKAQEMGGTGRDSR